MTPTDAGEQGRSGGAASGQGRLARGVLSDVDIAAATLADMAPAMSFFFGSATIAAAAGIAAPLTVIAATIAIALLGNTLSQFSRASRSRGRRSAQSSRGGRSR